MANRHTLHVNDLPLFKKWLVLDGWKIEPNKDFFEVVRAKKVDGKYKRFFAAYKRLTDNLQHYSVSDWNSGVIKAFYKWKKEREKE